MLKTLRGIVGLPIRETGTKKVCGFVRDLIINPANGALIAVAAKAQAKIILPIQDVQKLNKSAVWIEDCESLTAPTEIVRVAEVLKLKVPIFNNRVFTVSRQFLGQVIDFEFQTKGFILTKIEVAKKILGIPTNRKIISTKQIIQIKSSEITVQDALVRAQKRRLKGSNQLELASGF